MRIKLIFPLKYLTVFCFDMNLWSSSSLAFALRESKPILAVLKHAALPSAPVGEL